MRVLIALRFFASGAFQQTIGDLFNVDRRTVGRIISRFSSVLSRRLGEFVQLPASQREADAEVHRFYQIAGFPNVLGCIGCTHVQIIAPVINEFEYVNRKGKHTINVQLVCNANMTIMNCVVRWPGSVHDARILRESNLFRNFEGAHIPLQGVFLGDSGYMLRPWLMTPFLNPAGRAQENYNAAHCSTRSVIERTNGVLKRRWHCLHGELRYDPASTCNIILACIVLHNIAIHLRLPEPEPAADNPDDEEIDSDDDEADNAVGERRRMLAGHLARNRLVEQYFNARRHD